MRHTAIFFLTFLVAMIGTGCGGDGASTKGLTIKGQLEGSSNLTVYLDEVGVNPASANTVIAKTTADAGGNFSIPVEAGLDAGLYRLRAGAQRVSVILEGNEKVVNVSGDLGKLNTFQYSVSGSPSSAAYQSVMSNLAARKLAVKDVKTFVDTTSSAITAMMVAVNSLGNQNKPEFMQIHRAATSRMKKDFPNTKMESDYGAYVASLKKIKASRGNGFTYIEEAERQVAPDIKLPSPNGKEYALSDLKGQVVLVDFWASWCGPCRRENPNVVRVYDKYKDKGFTVFSVSLDGIDSRTSSRMGGDQKKIADYVKAQKKKWEDAIKKDNLKWDYHVSDLKKWECAPAREYGVSSIPRTFMIDKEGRIAAMNLRGAAVEETLLKLL